MVSMPLSAQTQRLCCYSTWSIFKNGLENIFILHDQCMLKPFYHIACLRASNKKTKLCFKTASTSKCKVLQQWKLTQFEFLTPSKLLTAPLTDLHSVSFKSLSVNVKLLNWKRKWPKMKQEFLHWARTEGLTEQISRASCFTVMTAFTGYFIVTAE